MNDIAEPLTTDRILRAMCATEWLIEPEWLPKLMAIAQRAYDSPESVLAKAGKLAREAPSATLRDGVAVLPVYGPLFRYANLFTSISGATSIEMLAPEFGNLVRKPEVKAIILDIDSPGGMVAGVSEFAEQVREASQVKHVTAYVSDLGASAAYWIASAAGELVIRDTARVGSIGVALRALRDDGEPNTVKIISSQSPLKQATAGTPEGLAQHQATVDRLAQVFIDTVARYRGLDTGTVMKDFGQGGVLVGTDAVRARMADRLGSLESEIARLSVTKPKPPPASATVANDPHHFDLAELPGKSRSDALLWAAEAWQGSSEVRAAFGSEAKFRAYCCGLAAQAPRRD